LQPTFLQNFSLVFWDTWGLSNNNYLPEMNIAPFLDGLVPDGFEMDKIKNYETNKDPFEQEAKKNR